jgi:hypothetical protein
MTVVKKRTVAVPHAESFPPNVVSKLKAYVYRLIDPRNGETFYVGKGRGNRVFAHIRDELSQEGDELSDKLKRIREIRLAGFEVAHVIHRHGMDDATAFEVESALMDAYPGLTGIAGGIGSNDYGAMHAKEIIRRYSAPAADFRHRAILISVNRSAAATSLYEATRYAWKISRRKAMQADVILATLRGLIVGAFIADDWLPAIAADFPGHEDAPGRLAFIGREASPELQAEYVGKRVPDEYRKKGVANPIKYTWTSARLPLATSRWRLQAPRCGDARPPRGDALQALRRADGADAILG